MLPSINIYIPKYWAKIRTDCWQTFLLRQLMTIDLVYDKFGQFMTTEYLVGYLLSND